MKYRPLGRSDIQVSVLCLGSMTWGSQNSEDEGHRQIDIALDTGVNFIDTAEMYPVNPLSAETQGRTEEIIGSWISRSGRRDDVVLATKVTGKGYRAVRDGAPVSAATIREAVEGSLRRLRTDYIDLYQVHWPNRGSYHFRQAWGYDPTGQDREATREHLLEVLQAMDELVKAGKVRQIGVSNESAWGVCQYLELAQRHRLPRLATIQNEYSLMHRLFDLDLAELSHNEDVGLLAYSPLATGILSGKYQGDRTPEGSRRNFHPDLGGRYTDHAVPAVDAYLDIARRHGIDSCQMALAFCLTRPFMTSAIFGATSTAQLENSLCAVEVELGQEILAEIEAVHRRYPIPM